MNITEFEEKVRLVTSDVNIGRVLGSIGASGLVVSSVCTYYIYSKITVNPFIKKLLLAMSIQQMITFSISFIVSILVFYYKILNKWTHFLMVFNYIGLGGSYYILSTLLSMIRLHFGLKISQMKIPNIQDIQKYVLKVLAMHYFFCFVLSYVFSQGCFLLVCQNFHQNYLLYSCILFYYWYSFIVFLIGLVCDARMILFLKSRNKIQPVQGIPQDVPFFSGGKDELEHTIPKNASIISCGTCIITSFSTTPLLSGIDMQNQIWWLCLIMCGLFIVQMPLIIKYTIKKKTKAEENSNKVENNPRRVKMKGGLNFHGGKDHESHHETSTTKIEQDLNP